MFMLEKICIKNKGVHHSLKKNETATMFFLKKPFFLVIQAHKLKPALNETHFGHRK